MLCVSEVAEDFSAPMGAVVLQTSATLQKTQEAPRRRNVFTVSHARTLSCIPLRRTVPDMASQEVEIARHRTALHEQYIASHEAQAVMTTQDRVIAVKMLLCTAAQRDVAVAKKVGYPQPVIEFMKTTWKAFLQQAQSFLGGSTQEAAAFNPAERCHIAMESISSIGVWFTGANVSLPLRQYTVQMIAPDGSLQNVFMIGLLSFSYSSYVMQMRLLSQQALLVELQKMGKQLGTPCLFMPELVLAP